MSEFNEMLSMALRERQAANTNPDGSSLYCAWNGNPNLPCAAGDASESKKLGLGGWGEDADLIMIIELCDLVPGFGTAADLVGKVPAKKQTIIYQGKTYRIDETTIPPGLAFIALALIDPSKGA